MSGTYVELAEECIKQQRKSYLLRKAHPDHGEPIRSAIALTKSDQDFNDITQYVFGHHELSDFRPIRSDNVDVNNELAVSKYFHSYHFRDVTLHQGARDTNPPLSDDEIFDLFTDATWGQGNNPVRFFVGGIGSGKTTYLCNYVYNRFGQFTHKRVIPVRVNLDVEDDHSARSLSENLRVIINTTITQLEINKHITASQASALKRECRIPKDADEKELDIILSHLLETLHARHSYRATYIIDNIDFLYHLGDRGFFSKTVHEDQDTAYSAILDLISFFWRKKGEFRTASLGINIIFSVRKDTLEFIRSRQKEVPIPGMDGLSFCIEGSDKAVALEIIESRFEMLSELIEKVPEQGKRLQFLNTARTLRDAYRKPTTAGLILFDDLWRLCRRGLRDIIDQMADYSWLEFHDERRQSATLRFATQYYPSIIAYGTDGCRRYTQFSGNLPNLFLINASVDNNEYAVDPNFKSKHFYTLWLKWMMLSYVQARQDETTTSDELIAAMCGGNGRAYSENLVRYVLGALTETPSSELIEVDIGADGDGGRTGFVRDMSLTRRGEYLLSDFSKTFSYFQMVVDDWRLLLPRELKKDFGYLDPDYSYLVAPDEEYGSKVRTVVERKGQQSLKLAILLDECLGYERGLYPNVFSRLEHAGVDCGDGVGYFAPLQKDVLRAGRAVRADISNFSTDAEWYSDFRETCRRCLDEIFETPLALHELFYDESIV
ncbi:hypothetical protein EBB79_04010 [Parasedimentitalea marina]|uniref:Uncharacterized protein n=1 Tax=Parasedimentitalea marina TaxID=2483033 RepID=A0A3T0MZE6_9RHOB|nr:hypothetical protein [Parasedimentitalea marina]AZV77138.1 hypothetical protein EBB79_04010 [Parasedimentitalea marina]